MTRKTYLVTADVPNDASTADVREFMKDALQSMGGCRHPEDPMFHSLGKVTVRPFKQDKTNDRELRHRPD